jgi:pyruvate formate lyase activating enzyme
MDRVLREKSYLLPNKGGVTVSGGEPLLQPEFVTSLFRATKMAGLTTCLDTSGMGRTTDYTKLLENTDHVMLCVKSLNPILHHDISGLDIKHLYRFVGALDKAKSPFRVRHVLITDGKYKTNSDEEIDRLTDFINARDHCSGIEVLPYHSMGVPKWASLNKAYPMQSTLSPTAVQVQDIITRLRDKLSPSKSIIV